MKESTAAEATRETITKEVEDFERRNEGIEEIK